MEDTPAGGPTRGGGCKNSGRFGACWGLLIGALPSRAVTCDPRGYLNVVPLRELKGQAASNVMWALASLRRPQRLQEIWCGLPLAQSHRGNQIRAQNSLRKGFLGAILEKRTTSYRDSESRAPRLLKKKPRIPALGPTPNSFGKNSKNTEKRRKILENMYFLAFFSIFEFY